MESLFLISVYVLLFLTTYFEVFLLVTYFENRAEFKDTKSKLITRLKYPGVTIIVPAYNEGETLAGTINSLLRMDYPKESLQIFIVDDGSKDNTLEAANRFRSEPQVKIFSKENGGKYTALNLGINNTNSELIGCLDADSFVAPDALKEMIPYLDDAEVMAVTPSVQIHNPNNILRRIQNAEYMSGEFVRKIFSRFNGLYVTPGPFSIYRRIVFEKIGQFMHAYNTEDMEMALRMQSHGMRIENAHTALVYTVAPKTISGLFKQRVRWTSGFLKNCFFKYRQMFFNKRYGNLGLLTMPFAFASTFITIFFGGLYFNYLLGSAYERYLKYSALGLYFRLRSPNFDWFAVNLGFLNLIVYMLFLTTIFFVFMGAKMVLKRFGFPRDIVYFIFLYGLLAPFWLAQSLFNLVTAKEARWR